MLRPLPARLLACTVLVTVILGGSCAAWAVSVSTTQGNTAAPPDDPGWANVGTVRGSSAVYLGDRWVLTAAHVGFGSVTFPGLGTFAGASGTSFQLTNPPESGLTKPADLLMFQLVDDPGLPPIRVATETPLAGDEVVAIGNGIARADDPSYWKVTQQRGNWIWTESVTPSDYEGFKTTGPQILRWGTNLIEDDETFGNDFDDDILTKLRQTTSDTLTLLTEFDKDNSTSDDDLKTATGSSATTYESQAVVNDSGGALLLKRDGIWELVGTILAVEGHRNQPDVTHNPMFGNTTHYANLASYVEQIEQRTIFGDFDHDLQLTVADIDALSGAVLSDLDDPRFDLNRDSAVDDRDHRIWVEQLAYTYYGDADLNGEFGTSDLILVLQAGQYEDTIVGNSTWATGDWDADREFTTRDFVTALQSGAFEQGARPEFVPLTSAAATVPEPAGAILGAIGAVLLVVARGRFQPRRWGPIGS